MSARAPQNFNAEEADNLEDVRSPSYLLRLAHHAISGH
jgi:hypothetical protein